MMSNVNLKYTPKSTIDKLDKQFQKYFEYLFNDPDLVRIYDKVKSYSPYEYEEWKKSESEDGKKIEEFNIKMRNKIFQ